MVAVRLFVSTSTTRAIARFSSSGSTFKAKRLSRVASTSSRRFISDLEMEPPKVVILGGGPGGLLAGIMLNNLGIRSTIVERSKERDAWSTKSYTIVLNERGQGALKRAGCLEAALTVGQKRQYVYLVEGKTGEVKAVPKTPAGLGFTRPLLMECLESIAAGIPNITLKRGSGACGIEKCSSSVTGMDHLQVLLDDGTMIHATHVIGADGKWSKVRHSIASFRSKARMITCPSFAVHMNSTFTPAGWKRDGTYVIRPGEGKADFYIIASPLPEEGTSITMVCESEILENYPWLEPPPNTKPQGYDEDSWENEFSKMPLQTGVDSSSNTALPDQLETLFKRELPAFYEVAVDRETLQSARIHRRVTWIHGLEEYSAENGMVALIGDAAHAMTASMGEGCNTALESAVKLAEAVSTVMQEKGEGKTESSFCTSATLSKAFVRYGATRPKEVVPIQEMSAARNGWKKEN